MSGFCEAHGPYDGNFCPFPPPHTQGGSSSRPVPPAPLDDDDLVTDLRGGGGYGQQTGPTMPPGSFDEQEDETQPPSRAKRGILDIDEDEETQVGRGGRGEARDDETELAEPLSPTLAMLWVKEGDRIGKFYPIRPGVVIGRKYNKSGDLILDEPKVSSSHAKFTMEDDKFFIWDLGSTNGTFVNGRKIREATLLEENDLIKIGETVFVVKLLESKPKRRSSRSAENPKNSSTRKAAKK